MDEYINKEGVESWLVQVAASKFVMSVAKYGLLNITAANRADGWNCLVIFLCNAALHPQMLNRKRLKYLCDSLQLYSLV